MLMLNFVLKKYFSSPFEFNFLEIKLYVKKFNAYYLNNAMICINII